LYNVHSSKKSKYKALQSLLIERLNNRYITIVIMILLHFSIVTLNAQEIGLAIMIIFIAIIYIKIYSFNKFMHDNTKLAEKYKKNPEDT